MWAMVFLLLRGVEHSQNLHPRALLGASRTLSDLPRHRHALSSLPPLRPRGQARVCGEGVAQAATATGDPGSGRAASLSGPARPRSRLAAYRSRSVTALPRESPPPGRDQPAVDAPGDARRPSALPALPCSPRASWLLLFFAPHANHWVFRVMLTENKLRVTLKTHDGPNF